MAQKTSQDMYVDHQKAKERSLKQQIAREYLSQMKAKQHKMFSDKITDQELEKRKNELDNEAIEKEKMMKNLDTSLKRIEMQTEIQKKESIEKSKRYNTMKEENQALLKMKEASEK